MTKNAPAAPDATLTLLTVAEASEAPPRKRAPFSMTSRCLEPCFSEANPRDACR